MHTTGLDSATLIPEGATIRRRYWAVPDTYTVGPEFATEREAIEHGLIARREAINSDAAARGITVEQSLVPERFSVDLRWDMTYPAGGGMDVIARRTTYGSLDEATEHLARLVAYTR